MTNNITKKVCSFATHLSLSVVLVLFLMASCSKNSTGDLSDLLKTVPSDASAVVATDVRTLLEKAGCRVSDDGEVKLSAELQAAIQTISDPVTRENMTALFTGQAGVAPTYAVVFMEGADTYLTFMLDDPDAFAAYAEKTVGGKLVATGDICVCGNMAMLANQGWMRVGNTADVDAGEILKFSRMSESQSFASHTMAPRIIEAGKDIVCWTDVEGMFNMAGSGTNDRMMYRLALASVFDDAASAWTEIDFSKGKATLSTRLLTSKGEDAKCNFPTSTIDVKTVESIGGRADLIMAASISSAFSKKLEKIASGFGGGVDAMLSGLMKPLDGTLAAALVSKDGKSEDLRAVVTVDGKSPTADLTSFLNGFGTVKRDGKFLRIEGKGNDTAGGDFLLEKEAKRLSGAWIAVMLDSKVLAGYGERATGFSSVLLTVRPSGKSLDLKVELQTPGDDNALLAFLRTLGGK